MKALGSGLIVLVVVAAFVASAMHLLTLKDRDAATLLAAIVAWCGLMFTDVGQQRRN